MDRGAARSKKRAEKEAAAAASSSKLDLLMASDRKDRGDRGDRPQRERKERKPRPLKQNRVDPNDPNRFKAKAVRTAHALVFSQEAFAIPPPAERLAGVTRIDLEGSGCADVSWLPASTTWLSLKNCPVTAGWDTVGGLENLAVLNISGCGLTALPEELRTLANLKALVAVGNEWTTLSPAVAGWKLLNSLIISHSPNLASLPSELSELKHLAKLTLSHCPRFTCAGFPDLSSLPLLRDVRANNLPRLTALPAHLATWGTGSLAQVGKKPVPGDGLEVLDVGNCSLPVGALKVFLGPVLAAAGPRFAHLRSLTLSANPLCLEAEGYAAQLQDSAQLPKLQIIDARRLVERKRAGELPESKRDRRQRERAAEKRRPTGANVDASERKMRTWGAAPGTEAGAGAGADADADASAGAEGERPKKPKGKGKGKPAADDEDEATSRIRARMERAAAEMELDEEPAAEAGAEDGGDGDGDDDGGKRKRKRKRTRKAEPEPEPEPAAARPAKKLRDATAAPGAGKKAPKDSREAKDGKGRAKPKKRAGGPDQAAVAAAAADPTTARASRPSRSETAVVGVVDVAGAGGAKQKAARGVDLAAVLKGGGAGSGLGVGGW